MGHPRVCLVSVPTSIGDNVQTRTQGIVEVLEPLVEELFLLTGPLPSEVTENPKIHTKVIGSRSFEPGKQSMPIRFFRFFLLQLRVSFRLVTIAPSIQVVIFRFPNYTFLLPLITARLLGRKTIVFRTGFGDSAQIRYQHRRWLSRIEGAILYQCVRAAEKLSFRLANRIIFLSESMKTVVDKETLNNYESKISVCYDRFISTGVSHGGKSLSLRDNIVGYIGWIQESKGVTNLIKAIPLLDGVRFMFAGDGSLARDMEKRCQENGTYDRVQFLGWVSRSRVFEILTEMRLLVLPSYSEGLPTVVLEAMACGTPVLATRVGGIPDVVEDGKTGFIMENNSLESIAQNVRRALNHPDLEQIAQNARALVERKFTFEKAVENYRDILSKL